MLRVNEVADGSQAQKLGIQPGDHLSALEGSLVESGAQLDQLVQTGIATDRLTLEWVTPSGELKQGRMNPKQKLGLTTLDDAALVAEPRDTSGEVAVKTNSNSYGFARFAIGLISAVGLLVMVLGLIVVITGLAGFTLMSSLGGLGTGGGMILMGVLYVGLAQCFGAIIDTAINTQKTVALMESRA